MRNASERSSQKTYKPRAAGRFARGAGICFKSSGSPSAAFPYLSFLPYPVPPFFLPYLRQLRQVPVMPGGAAETLCAALPHKEFFCKHKLAKKLRLRAGYAT